MKSASALLTVLTAGLFFLLQSSSFAQNPFGGAEGSRPGETYHTGSAPPPASQATPGYYQSQPTQPSAGRPSGNASSARRSNSSSTGIHPAGTPVIMEFSDLQCPDSARYNRELKNTVLQRYVSSGRVAYEWHDFPLPVHAQAPEAAAAARCAGSSADRMRQQIMANQGQMSANVYAGYARQLGIDPQSFASCEQEGTSMRAVMNDQALGKSLGVRGTPTLVLGISDGKGSVRPVKVVKAYDPPQQVMEEIDNFLASAKAPRQQQPR